MNVKKTMTIFALTSAIALVAGCKAEKAPEAAEAEAPAAAAAANADAPSAAKGDDLLGTTCGHYLGMMVMANPGKDANDEQKARAEDAQDELFNVMMWAHGYATGKGGSVASAEPLTKDWMVDKIGKLAAVCKADSSEGEMRLADAVAKL
jgi:cytochrome c5